MAGAKLHCIFVLLLYSQGSYGQTALGNNQNTGVNSAAGLQQQNLQRGPRNFHPNQNGPINNNLSQPPNLQANSQLSSSVSGTNQGNLQQQLNLPPTLQSQTSSLQNNFQITKIGFTPVSPGTVSNPPTSTQLLQNEGFQLNGQFNAPASQMLNSPITLSNLAELAALKGQSLLSMLNPQNNCQPQQNQPIFPNYQNQLTDAQKQYLVKSLQGQNQQEVNVVQTQPRVVNIDNQAITIRAVSQPQQGQAIVTPLGTQPAYITVQAQPIATYLPNQTPQVIAEEEPSILSLILSELGPQYAVNSNFTPPKKGSKMNLKTLIPLIIGLLKEKNCACRNCGCPNSYQNDDNPNVKLGPQMAQIIGGYSNQRDYNQNSENTVARIKKNDNVEASNNDKDRKNNVEKIVNNESEEFSDEDDSEYIDDEE